MPALATEAATGTWPASSTRRQLSPRLALLGLVVATVAGVAHFTWSSYFFYDDYVFLRQAQRHGLSLGFLLEPLNPHFSPGHRLANWTLQRFFPLNFALAQAVLLACLAASIVVLHHVLAQLFGRRPGTLLLTFVYATSIVHVGVVQWWNGGLLVLPAAVLSLVCIDAYLGFHRTGSRRLLALSVGALVLALLFYLKAVLVPLYLLLLRVLVLEPGRPVRAAVADTAREWRVWAAYAVPAGVYLAVFLTGYWQPADAPSLDLVAEYLEVAWARVFAPSVFGLRTPTGAASLADEVAVVAMQVVVAAIVVVSIRRRRSAWRAWAFFLVAFLANALVVGLPRLGGWGTGIAYFPRYHLEATFLLPIAVGAAFWRVGGPGRVAAPGPRPRWWGRPALARAAIALAVATHLVLAWDGAGRLRAENPGQAAGRYMRQVEAGLRQARRSGIRPTLVDRTVPDYVFPAWAAYGGRYNRYSEVFPLIDPGLAFDTPSPALFDVAQDGRLRAVRFSPVAGGGAWGLAQSGAVRVTHGTVEGVGGRLCVRSGAWPALVELTPPAPLTGSEWFVALRYEVARRMTLPVYVDRGSGYPYPNDRSVTLRGGRAGAVMVPLGGPSLVRLRLDLPPDAHACLADLEVGRLLRRR